MQRLQLLVNNNEPRCCSVSSGHSMVELLQCQQRAQHGSAAAASAGVPYNIPGSEKRGCHSA